MTAIPRDNIRGFLHRISTARTSNEKGRALEDFICELFSYVPGIAITRRNPFNQFQTEEIDVVLWNDKVSNGFNFLPNLILVECKNWNNPVSTQEVAYFVDRLRDRGCDHGFLIAANGITGNPRELTNANYKIARALSDGLKVIVVTIAELEAIQNIEELVSLMKRKLCDLVATGTSIV